MLTDHGHAAGDPGVQDREGHVPTNAMLIARWRPAQGAGQTTRTGTGAAVIRQTLDGQTRQVARHAVKIPPQNDLNQPNDPVFPCETADSLTALKSNRTRTTPDAVGTALWPTARDGVASLYPRHVRGHVVLLDRLVGDLRMGDLLIRAGTRGTFPMPATNDGLPLLYAFTQ